MKKLLITLFLVFILTFSIPFLSLIDRGESKKESEKNELVTIFGGQEEKD